MDIRLSEARPSDAERAAVDSVLGPQRGRWEDGGHAARGRRHLLLPTLHAINDACGWISPGALDYACERLTIPPAEAYGVATFYHMFSLKPRPTRVVYVCDDIACACAGAERVCDGLESSQAADAAWVRSACLGLCASAPAALIVESGPEASHHAAGPVTADDISAYLRRGERPVLRRVEPRIGVREAGSDQAALARAFDLGPDGVIAEVVAAKLMGRGGAAFSTGRKWEAVAREPALPHYVVCNADESEPGTFKDNDLMTCFPDAIVAAMTIAAYAGRCEKGYVYVRGEYRAQHDALRAAIERARAAGRLGADILGRGFAFDIETRRGAGAYICGEETALFNSIEGRRGEPRNKPPFPVQRGLFGKPTIVNNVETLFNVPEIVLRGGAAFARSGTSDSTGTRLFCLSGHVARPGTYEVPMGTTLRALIATAGGVRGGKRLQAVLLGGAAGTFLTPDEIDVPLSFEGTRAIKATLGSGVVMLFDETVDLRAIVARIARFFREESCGQCVPCRVGTARQEELLERLAHGAPIVSAENERGLLGEIGQAMRDASICGLGQTASSAIESAMAKFDLYSRGAPA